MDDNSKREELDVLLQQSTEVLERLEKFDQEQFPEDFLDLEDFSWALQASLSSEVEAVAEKERLAKKDRLLKKIEDLKPVAEVAADAKKYYTFFKAYSAYEDACNVSGKKPTAADFFASCKNDVVEIEKLTKTSGAVRYNAMSNDELAAECKKMETAIDRYKADKESDNGKDGPYQDPYLFQKYEEYKQQIRGRGFQSARKIDSDVQEFLSPTARVEAFPYGNVEAKGVENNLNKTRFG